MAVGSNSKPEVLFLADGGLGMVVPNSGLLRHVAEVLDRDEKRRVHAGHLPTPGVAVFVEFTKHVAALTDLISVPHSEPGRASKTASVGRWVTTKQAGQMLGITDRAIRKRITNDQLPAQFRGGRWFIDMTEVQTDAA